MDRDGRAAYELGLRLRQAFRVQETVRSICSGRDLLPASTACDRLVLAFEAALPHLDLGMVTPALTGYLTAIAEGFARALLEGMSEVYVDDGVRYLESFRIALQGGILAKRPPPSRLPDCYRLGWEAGGILFAPYEPDLPVDPSRSERGGGDYVREPGSEWIWPWQAIDLMARLRVPEQVLFPEQEWADGRWQQDSTLDAFWEALPHVEQRPAWVILEAGLRQMAVVPPAVKRRRQHDRDHVFLQLKEGPPPMTNAAIAKRWNAEHPGERAVTTCVVKHAVRKARRERGL